jgi:hypothetical protein
MGAWHEVRIQQHTQVASDSCIMASSFGNEWLEVVIVHRAERSDHGKAH